MLLLYYMILSVLESFISFFVSHNLMICDCDRCHASITLYLSLKSKTKKKRKKINKY